MLEYQDTFTEALKFAEERVQKVLADLEVANADIQAYNQWFRKALAQLQFDLPKITTALRKIGFEVVEVKPKISHRGKSVYDGTYCDWSKEGIYVEIRANMCGRRKPQTRESYRTSRTEQCRRQDVMRNQEAKFKEETQYSLNINQYSLDKAEGCFMSVALTNR
jgi:uncharacterized protein (DUF885 family)